MPHILDLPLQPASALDPAADMIPLRSGGATHRVSVQDVRLNTYVIPPGTTDVGAAISTAIAAAVANGISAIRWEGGGTLLTPVVIPAGFRLHLGAGDYYAHTGAFNFKWLPLVPFLMKDNSVLEGDGDKTILYESDGAGNLGAGVSGIAMIIGSYNYFDSYDNPGNYGGHGYSGGNSNVVIRNLQLKGPRNPNLGGTLAAIYTGNSVAWLMENLLITGVSSGGIFMGGNSVAGGFADQCTVVNCRFTGGNAVAVAVTNGQNIRIADNMFIKWGMGGSTSCIDIEPNVGSQATQGTSTVGDRAINISITGNMMDFRGANAVNPYGITVQTSAAEYCYGITIMRNTIIGGEVDGTPTFVATSGINLVGAYEAPAPVRNALSAGISAGATSIPVYSSSGFTNGSAVIFDTGSGQERKTQSGAPPDGTHITVAAVANNHSINSTVVQAPGTAIYMRECQVIDNLIIHTGQAGIACSILKFCTISGNVLVDCGGTPAMSFRDMHHCTIQDNTVLVTGESGGGTSTLTTIQDIYQNADYNLIVNNRIITITVDVHETHTVSAPNFAI